jgi:hypothetical protein
MRRERVLGVFASVDDAAAAVRALRAKGRGDVVVIMPAPFPQLIEALGVRKSPIRWATLAGAAAGATGGLAWCIRSSLAWPLLTGGKPIVSMPPFVIIAFEVAVLVGVLSTLVAGAVAAQSLHRDRISAVLPNDRVGVLAGGDDLDNLEALLRGAGAEEVRRER